VCATAQVRVAGRVVNETGAPLAGARLTLRAGDFAGVVFSDPTGVFEWTSVKPGDYQIDVECAGYFALRDRPLVVVPGLGEIQFTLNRLREQFESVEVTAPPGVISLDTTGSPEGVTGTQILNVPYPTTNDLRSALRILPNVKRDQRGGLHIHGGGEDQVLYTLNGFNVTDPLTGRFETRLSVESIQSVDVVSGRYSAEYGKGAAGALVIHTRSGDDKMRYSATNFVPGVEHRKGLILGDWTPRLNVSGPIRRSRAWFSESVDVQYSKSVVEDLPTGEDRTSAWRASSLTHTQWNLTPSNILYAGLLTNHWVAPRSGLGALDPIETTVDRRSRQWLFHIKDQFYLPRRALVEIGYAWNRTFGREIPQGQEIYLLLPDGKRGNHFVDAERKASRDQVIVNSFLPSFTLAGGHQLKAGLDWDRVAYWQDVRRTGYDYYGGAGLLVRRTVFAGSGELRRSNHETALYVQDSWRVRPKLLLEIGLRGDRDRILDVWSPSPRFGVAWSPPGLENTKISAGYAQVYDATNLRLFTRPQDQYALSTYYSPNGAVGRGPAVSVFTIANHQLRRPRYRNWSAGFEQRWPASLYTRLEFLRRRGGRGFTYVNTITSDTVAPPDYAEYFGVNVFDAVYDLSNRRRDIYDSVEFTVRQTMRRQHEWLASYTWSRARSNAVVDLSLDDPLLVSDNVGRMPWDAPHRLISWGYLPTFWQNWAVAYLTELRSGYPFSVQNDFGGVIGSVNERRFPAFFEANLHLERRFAFRGHRWALRFGSNNITNRRNPDSVINNPSSPRFLTYLGGAGRSTNFRIRWLGRL
jgi:outer membrane receptor protein involved in Fe transport